MFLFIVPVFIVGGILGYIAIHSQSSRNDTGGIMGVDARQIGTFIEEFQLAITIRAAQKTRLYLSNAEKRLSEITELKDAGDSFKISQLAAEYTETIRLALESTDEIKDPEERGAVLLEAFNRLAYHQPILRAIRRRPPLSPLSSIDSARYGNMAVQEQLVKRITQLRVGSGTTSASSTTNKLLACPGCNVVIVSLTTLRKDHIGLYGYERPTTPNIDAFFKDSLKFTNTLAPSAWTIPDAVSLQTSLFPYTHGIAIREPPSTPLLYNREVLTLAQILSKNGYRTAAFTGGGDYNRRYSGLDRGFDFYLDEVNYEDFNISGDFPLGNRSLFYAPLRSFVGMSTKWLSGSSRKPFFLLVQGYDLHCPYSPHEPFAGRFTAGLKSDLDYSICYTTYGNTSSTTQQGKTYWEVNSAPLRDGTFGQVRISTDDVRYMTALYDARIAEADYYLDELFRKIQALGLEKNTIIVLMSEHGEMLGENGWFMRGGSTRGTVYEPALNFPLLIKHPNVSEPIVIDDPVQTVDIMPTLLTMLGLGDPQASLRQGKPLTFSTFGDTPTNEYVYAASMFFPYAKSQLFNVPTAAEAIRDKEWKLIKNSVFTESGLRTDSVTYELYNITQDPYEQNDLYKSEKERAQSLRGKLETWLDHFTQKVPL